MVGHGRSSASSYLADPTSPIPSHRASFVVTSTLRVKNENRVHYLTVMHPHGEVTLHFHYLFTQLTQQNVSGSLINSASRPVTFLFHAHYKITLIITTVTLPVKWKSYQNCSHTEAVTKLSHWITDFTLSHYTHLYSPRCHFRAITNP